MDGDITNENSRLEETLFRSLPRDYENEASQTPTLANSSSRLFTLWLLCSISLAIATMISQWWTPSLSSGSGRIVSCPTPPTRVQAPGVCITVSLKSQPNSLLHLGQKVYLHNTSSEERPLGTIVAIVDNQAPIALSVPAPSVPGTSDFISSPIVAVAYFPTLTMRDTGSSPLRTLDLQVEFRARNLFSFVPVVRQDTHDM
jgi:hypothetical protein